MAIPYSEAGKKGGLICYIRHGSEFYKEIGKLGGKAGGRPRNKTLAEAREGLLNKYKGGRVRPGSFQDLLAKAILNEGAG